MASFGVCLYAQPLRPRCSTVKLCYCCPRRRCSSGRPGHAIPSSVAAQDDDASTRQAMCRTFFLSSSLLDTSVSVRVSQLASSSRRAAEILPCSCEELIVCRCSLSLLRKHTGRCVSSCSRRLALISDSCDM